MCRAEFRHPPAIQAGSHLATLLLTALCAGTTPVGAQERASTAHPVPSPSVRAAQATGTIEVDGRLDEAAWAAAQPATDFRQSRPDDGQPATQRTEVRFLYDDHALYIGARMYDDLGAAGVTSRLVRRDVTPESDMLTFTFDTYHDHLGQSQFRINPAGVKGDALAMGASNLDPSWDPVWEVATSTDSLGWTAELRIPFSQLRFPQDPVQVWGLQVVRHVNRLNEWSQWSWWSIDETGGPSRYGHLEELVIATQPRRVELLPYAVAQSRHPRPGATGDPFHSAHQATARVGADMTWMLTSNLTLSASVNPDFGQVEVDPAVVNLSAFETFFAERRPFFVEGAGVFDYGSFWCFFCSNVSSLDLFYSRRIGRPPQGAGLAHTAAQHADVPVSSTILAAAKLTGRTQDGWTLGALNAVTGREHARLAADDEFTTMEVEPLSNYFVGRAKRDLRDGNIVLGAMATSVVRDLSSPGLASLLPSRAESVGFDSEWWWRDKTYHLLAHAAVSSAAGSEAAMQRLQRSSARYFQRPDRTHGSNTLFSNRWDPEATWLRGWAAYARFAKDAGALRYETSANIRSPGFEVNDLAFITRSDYLWFNGNVFRRWSTPTRWYRNVAVMGGGQTQYNFSGDRTDTQLQAYAGGELPNYWALNAFVIRTLPSLDDRLTRGGPVVRNTGNWYTSWFLGTDSRKPLVLSTNPNYGRNDEGAYRYSVNGSVTVRPASNVSVTAGPSFNRTASTHQYVTAVDDASSADFHGRRYVFANLVQRSLSMNTRVNWTFSPTLSFELFAQPFIASGAFSDFKEFARPRDNEKWVFGRDAGSITETVGAAGERIYTVDPDAGGPAPAFSFPDPNFNLRSLRGNAVLRWEYRPGATVFLVWTQDRRDSASAGNLDFRRDVEAMFNAPAEHIFLLKANYRIGL
jgi:hypothetical protein